MIPQKTFERNFTTGFAQRSFSWRATGNHQRPPLFQSSFLPRSTCEEEKGRRSCEEIWCGVMDKRKAFTLVELLVVIAIIALLMAILMPALRRAKEQGRQAACASHLHQWGVIFTMYTGDHDGRFMPGIDEDWSTARYSWIYTLILYTMAG